MSGNSIGKIFTVTSFGERVVQNSRILFYAWPIIVQISVVLWAQKLEEKRWRLSLSTQGISSRWLYKIVFVVSVLYTFVYILFWWGGGISNPDTMKHLFPEIHPCEFYPMTCSVPQLWELGIKEEIVERCIRAGSAMIVPLLLCLAFWRGRWTVGRLCLVSFALFLIQEIAFAWLPL